MTQLVRSFTFADELTDECGFVVDSQGRIRFITKSTGVSPKVPSFEREQAF